MKASKPLIGEVEIKVRNELFSEKFKHKIKLQK